MAYNRANGRGAQRPNNFNRGTRNFNAKRPTFKDILRDKDPESFDVARFIMYSASLRRHVSLGIKTQMITTEQISSSDSFYVRFGLTKFTVVINGLGTDYPYSDTMLIRALLAACISTANQVQGLVNELCHAKFNEPLTECPEFTSDEGRKAIEEVATDVLKHINDANVVDKVED